MKETFENLILNQLDLTVYGEDKNAVKKKKQLKRRKKLLKRRKKLLKRRR